MGESGSLPRESRFQQAGGQTQMCRKAMGQCDLLGSSGLMWCLVWLSVLTAAGTFLHGLPWFPQDARWPRQGSADGQLAGPLVCPVGAEGDPFVYSFRSFLSVCGAVP